MTHTNTHTPTCFTTLLPKMNFSYLLLSINENGPMLSTEKTYFVVFDIRERTKVSFVVCNMYTTFASCFTLLC